MTADTRFKCETCDGDGKIVVREGKNGPVLGMGVCPDCTPKPPVWTKEEIDAARSRAKELGKKIGWGDPDDNDDENPQTRGDA